MSASVPASEQRKARQRHALQIHHARGGLGHSEQDRRESKERHRDNRHLLGRRASEQGRQRPDHQRQWNVDDPRPVHQRARRPVNAVLVEVEPALPGEQVAHLDQPENVVRVGKAALRDRRKAARDEEGRERQPHERNPDERNAQQSH